MWPPRWGDLQSALDATPRAERDNMCGILDARAVIHGQPPVTEFLGQIRRTFNLVVEMLQVMRKYPDQTLDLVAP